ncbi:hypothetical protein LEMLEM_LOCUS24270 [Lemmus lemmus]
MLLETLDYRTYPRQLPQNCIFESGKETNNRHGEERSKSMHFQRYIVLR